MADNAPVTDQTTKWIAEVFRPDLATKSELRVAGWIAYGAALGLIPVMVVSLLIIGMPASQVGGLGTILLFAVYAPFVYLFRSLRRLLNTTCGYHGADRMIGALIACQLTVAVTSLLVPAQPVSQALSGDGPELRGIAAIALYGSLLAYVGTGALFVAIGVKLRDLDGELRSQITPFRYTTIALGICTCLLVLLPIALVLAVVQAIHLGRLFQREAESPAVPDL